MGFHAPGLLIKTSVLLFLLGFGYLVFINANKEQKGLKSMGRAIGIVIITFALIGGILLTSFRLCFGISHPKARLQRKTTAGSVFKK